MNKAEFVKWLEQFPDDTHIQVTVVDWRGVPVTRYFDPNNECHFDYADMNGNPYVSPRDCHYNKRFLELGSSSTGSGD